MNRLELRAQYLFGCLPQYIITKRAPFESTQRRPAGGHTSGMMEPPVGQVTSTEWRTRDEGR